MGVQASLADCDRNKPVALEAGTLEVHGTTESGELPVRESELLHFKGSGSLPPRLKFRASRSSAAR